MDTSTTTRKNKRETPRTIAKELHEAWLALRRKGDPEVMAAALGYSRPVIDKALIYGYVSMQELPDKINEFFKNRMEKERADAAELIRLSKQK